MEEAEPGSTSEAPARGAQGGEEVVLERGPGVHVVADPHPVRAGRTLASTIGADFADTPAAARLAIRARLTRVVGPAGTGGEIDLRGSADVIDLRDPVTVLAGAAARGQAGPLDVERRSFSIAGAPTRTLAEAHVARLRQLAGAVERAERIRARTERAVSERLLAPEPPTAGVDRRAVRQAAAELLDARQAIDPLDPPSEPGVDLQQISQDPATQIPDRLRHPRNSAPIAGGVLLLAVALAGAILLTSAPPVLAIAPILLGLFIAALIRRTTPATGWGDTSRPFDTMSSGTRTGVSIDAPTAGETRSGPTPPDRAQTTDPEETDLSRAQRRLAEAQQRWTELAGPTADPAGMAANPTPIEAPTESVRAAASESAAVRAAALAADRARDAWRSAWAELGEVPPADATSSHALDEVLDRLQQRIEDGVTELSGLGDDAGDDSRRRRLNELLARRTLETVIEHEPGPAIATTAPLVLVEPFAGLDNEQRATMQRHLEALANRYEVIVIVRDGTPGAHDVDT